MINQYTATFDELAETCTALLHLYTQWAKQRGLSANEFFILYMLGRRGACTQKEISEEWHLPKQTVSFVCKQLQEKGWLTSEIGKQDKRGKQMLLTKTGAAYALPLVAELTQREAQAAEHFGTTDLIQIVHGLRRLHAVFALQLELPHAE